MKIVGIGCIHNDIEKIPFLLDKVEELKPDIVVVVGDVLDAEFPKGIKPIDVGRIVVTEFKERFKHLLFTPGTWDKELIDYYRKEGILLHGNGKIINEIGFYGFGGAKTPFNTPFEPDDEEIYKGIVKSYEEVKESKFKIQLTHAPPLHTSLDLIPSGQHVGSKAVRETIEKFQPHAAFCAHIHEGRGIDVLGKTKIVNVGKFTEGYVGVIVLSEEKIDAEIVNLK